MVLQQRNRLFLKQGGNLELLNETGIWIGAGVLLFCLLFVGWFLSGRKDTSDHSEREVNLTIDIEQLPTLPVTTTPFRLEIYGSPVRIRALVLAPIGRGQTLPSKEHLGNILNHFIPNFTSILDSHHPIFRRWPEQLSTSGFIQSFFNNLAIPNKGQGTIWCSIAGTIEVVGSSYLIGMVCSTDTPNSLSQITVERPGQWLDILRVHQA